MLFVLLFPFFKRAHWSASHGFEALQCERLQENCKMKWKLPCLPAGACCPGRLSGRGAAPWGSSPGCRGYRALGGVGGMPSSGGSCCHGGFAAICGSSVVS